MAKRLIKTVRGAAGEVKVHWNGEWSEYTVRLTGASVASIYHTTDKQDAMDTAASIARSLYQEADMPIFHCDFKGIKSDGTIVEIHCPNIRAANHLEATDIVVSQVRLLHNYDELYFPRFQFGETAPVYSMSEDMRRVIAAAAADGEDEDA